ncbi:hypothetical protein H0H93_013532 [Arthromyces matolae]|nr:hypothetical protein H0H93_013532 [Arthromyces matolae]
MLVERFVSRLGDDGMDIFARSPRCLAIFMAYIDLTESSVLSQPFMLAIDRTLVLNYPPRAESLSVSLEIIRLLGKMILSTPRGLLVPLLCGVEKGMCRWIADEKEALLAQEHAIVLEELYCSTLKLLREIPPSCETLVAITPFLCAGFGRLTASAIGPLNFSEFWRDTYHEIEEYRPSYPDSLKICLLGLNDAFGGSLADGLSMSQSSSIIPDSQPLYLDPDQGLSSGVQERQMESLVVDSDSAPELVTRRQSGSSQYNSPLPTPGQDPAIRSHDFFKDSGPNSSQITPQQKQPEQPPSQKRPSDSSTDLSKRS